MPFFEPISPPPPEEHEQAERVWAPPRWDRPSEGTLPVTFAVSQLFGRTVNAAFALDHLRVYPNGFQLVVTVIANPRLPPELHMGGFASFSLMATAKTTSADEDKPNPPPPPPRIRLRGGMLDMAPRLGIRFSNGQSAGSAPQSMFEVAKDEEGVPTQPVIVGGGGGGGGGHFRFEYWVFPLPTPGRLEVFAEWPLAGMEETSVVISGDDVLDASRRAIILWS